MTRVTECDMYRMQGRCCSEVVASKRMMVDGCVGRRYNFVISATLAISVFILLWLLYNPGTRIVAIRSNDKTDPETNGYWVAHFNVSMSSNQTARDDGMCRCSRNISHFQVYHISKCGGTHMRSVLRASLILPEELMNDTSGRWHFQDFGYWRRERENFPDPRYRGNVSSAMKQQTFILGLVRNPFGYYRSLYTMITSPRTYTGCKQYIQRHNYTQPAPRDCTCTMKLAISANKSHLFLAPENRNTDKPGRVHNKSAFNEWMDLLANANGRESHCRIDPEDMQGRHDKLIQMNDGSLAYDAVVKQEDYYPMTRKALKMFDCCMPNRVRFYALDALEKEQKKTFTRAVWYDNGGAGVGTLDPDFCYYSDKARKWVEENDDAMMRLYNYSWESFVGDAPFDACSAM